MEQVHAVPHKSFQFSRSELDADIPAPERKNYVTRALSPASGSDTEAWSDDTRSDLSDEEVSEEASSQCTTPATGARHSQQLQRGVAVMRLPEGHSESETRRELLDKFLPFGPIVRIDIPSGWDTAFVVFENGESAARAVGNFLGRPLRMHDCRLRVALRNRPNTPPHARAVPQHFHQQQQDAVTALPPISHTMTCHTGEVQLQRGVAVLGVPPGISEAELRCELLPVFQPFGTIVRIDIPFGRDTAFVIFENGESAARAVGNFLRRPLRMHDCRLRVVLRNRPNTPPQQRTGLQRGVAVMGLPSGVNEAELRRELLTALGTFGAIVRVDIPFGKDVAFVIFENGESAARTVGNFARRPLRLLDCRLRISLRNRPNTPPQLLQGGFRRAHADVLRRF